MLVLGIGKLVVESFWSSFEFRLPFVLFASWPPFNFDNVEDDAPLLLSDKFSSSDDDESPDSKQTKPGNNALYWN